MTRKPKGSLRRGWTTGACAAAAAKSALAALLTGRFLDPVSITLPRGEIPKFTLAHRALTPGGASAGIVKDAGDDPDVTHGALVIATVREGEADVGITFAAGEGVGRITKPGLPIPPGEPAINPAPREMIRRALAEITAAHGGPIDIEVEISIPGGAEIAQRTWNPRLGIVGGLSILGTTGIVRPFSCSAWIASIHRGVDVARATGLRHVVGATGATSEKTAQGLYALPDGAMLDMGDFVGGLLKYLRRHPVPRLTIAGGVGKMTKLALGALDLHSARSQVDFSTLANMAAAVGAAADPVRRANTALEAHQLAGLALTQAVAEQARQKALGVLDGAPVSLDTLIIDRDGVVIARTGDG